MKFEVAGVWGALPTQAEGRLTDGRPFYFHARQAGPSTLRWGGSWHCPSDATLMNEAEGRVSCAACGRSLPPRLLYGLVEFHVHKEQPSE